MDCKGGAPGMQSILVSRHEANRPSSLFLGVSLDKRLEIVSYGLSG
jgi:hypothetical protein